ncbi:hypothetical protein ACHHYP_13942 [Achlya hypogyna]|uniref:Uncharacterized protein n=1 Tax=Achlya hypogyna TaxID=1202772 RepID=A0A1V9YE97_ACHHY|nr:hypothetical protein ACHHYP_13942 [Achlya hypogyna]
MLAIRQGVVCRPVLTTTPWRLSYVIDNTTSGSYEVTLDFTGSSNLRLVTGGPSLACSMILRPFDRVRVSVCCIDESFRCGVRLRHNIADIDALDVNAAKQAEDSALAALLMSVQASAPADTSLLQGLPFVDTEFLPHDKILGEGIGDKCFTWKPLAAFYGEDAPIFGPGELAKTLSAGGPLTSPALAAALTVLGEDRALLERVILRREGKSRFGVRLYLHGEPKDLEVDGFVPCVPGGGPALARCTSDELWPLVLQKATAKLLGSYDRLRLVSVEALMAMVFGHPRCVMLQLAAGEYIIAIKQSAASATEPVQDDDAQLRRFFDAIDADMDDRVGRDDFERFMQVQLPLYEGGLALNDEAYAWLLKEFESDAKGLTFRGLSECYGAPGVVTKDYADPAFQAASQGILSVYVAGKSDAPVTLVQIE